MRDARCGLQRRKRWATQRIVPRTACVRLLEEAGFTYDRQIGAWLNIPAGRVIAFDRVANRSPEWLAAWIGLSRAHSLFIANGHDVRTMRFGSPALVLASDDNTPASRPLRIVRGGAPPAPRKSARSWPANVCTTTADR